MVCVSVILLSCGLICMLGSTSADPLRMNFDAELLDSQEQQRRDTRQFPITLDLSNIIDSVFSTLNEQINSSLKVLRKPTVRDCDKANFDLSPRDYRIVTDCQLVQSNDEGVKNCILSSKLSQKSNEFRNFLSENGAGDVKIETAIKSAIKNGKVSTILDVEVSKCLGEDVVGYDLFEGGFDEPTQFVPVDDVFSTPIATTNHKFNLPNIDQFFNSMFPTTINGSSIFSKDPFDQFQGILPKTTFPDLDMSNCMSKRFNLTVADFDTVRNCYNTGEVRACLGKSDLSNRNLVDFAVDEKFSLVGHTFSSYTAWHNGKLSRNHMVHLQRCAKDNQVDAADANTQVQERIGTDAASGAASPIENQEPDFERKALLDQEP